MLSKRPTVVALFLAVVSSVKIARSQAQQLITSGNYPPCYAYPSPPSYGSYPPSYGHYGSYPPSYGHYGSYPPSYGHYGSYPPSYGSYPPSYGSYPPSYGNYPPVYPPCYGQQATHGRALSTMLDESTAIPFDALMKRLLNSAIPKRRMLPEATDAAAEQRFSAIVQKLKQNAGGANTHDAQGVISNIIKGTRKLTAVEEQAEVHGRALRGGRAAQ